MVDAAASLQRISSVQGGIVDGRSGSIAIEVAGTDGLPRYADVAARGVFSPSQAPLWIERWMEHLAPDLLVATLSRDNQPQFSIALEVTRRGPVRVASFMGGRHANGNMPASVPAFAKTATAAEMQALFTAIGRARPDVDIIACERLATDIGNVANPLLLMPHAQSPNLSLAVDLGGGFDAMLARASGKRKRKKHRSQMRKFEAAGGYRRLTARTEAEADVLLDAFFAMKEVRFAKMGVANVFGQPAVKAFFRSIFADALRETRPSFVLHGLEVGGRIRAVTGSSRAPGRLICEFGAIADDDMAYASPGEFLFFDNIEEACAEGLAIYDFSVGDEPYKRLWCDLEIRQFDVFVPLTVKGRAFAAALHATSQLKGFVKNNRLVWNLVKTFRKKTASQPAAETED